MGDAPPHTKECEDGCQPPLGYVSISGKGLRLCEVLPEKPMDSRLIWKFNNWWLAVPSKEKLSLSENQGRVVAIDPGARSFISSE